MQELINILNSFVPEDEDQIVNIKSFKQALESFGEKIYSRDNFPAHVCSTAWVTNPERTKSLMGYHNIYRSFSWFGGHADGDLDLLKVAKKELVEETSISNFKVLNNGMPIDFLTSAVLTHIKRGKRVPDHLHYDPIYLFEISESEKFQIAIGENSAIKWVDNKEIMSLVDSKENESVKIVIRRILKNISKY